MEATYTVYKIKCCAPIPIPHPPSPPPTTTLSYFTFTKSDVDVVRPDLLAPFVQKLNTVKPVLTDKDPQDLHWCLFKRGVR